MFIIQPQLRNNLMCSLGVCVIFNGELTFEIHLLHPPLERFICSNYVIIVKCCGTAVIITEYSWIKINFKYIRVENS